MSPNFSAFFFSLATAFCFSATLAALFEVAVKPMASQMDSTSGAATFRSTLRMGMLTSNSGKRPPNNLRPSRSFAVLFILNRSPLSFMYFSIVASDMHSSMLPFCCSVMPSFVHSRPKSKGVPLSRPKSSIFREAVVGVRRGAEGNRLLEVVRAVAPTDQRVIVLCEGVARRRGASRDGVVPARSFRGEGRRATAACGAALCLRAASDVE
mmetsp:Transcript_10218/g.31846  ORF Transcript_10218/g.31846 Transcript_10218/m.31846 type:complete len:210 (+) Transcript_10218:248-877(+)